MPPHSTSSDPVSVTDTGQTERKEILYEGYFYDVTEWIKRHPGGNIIKFYTESGEDATCAVQQFHQRSTKKVMSIMKSLKRRPAKDQEIGLDAETLKRHRALTDDFTKLYRELEVEGYFKPSPTHIAYRIIELIVLASLGMYLMAKDCALYNTIGIFSFAMFQGRCGWLQHEGGHHSLTGNSKVDRFIQAIFYGLGDGMASSWWSSQHNRHHAMPQRLKRDVDLETLPLLAFNEKVVRNPKHGKNFFVQNQATLFLAIDTLLVATMWKVYLHPRYVITRGRYHELGFMLLHYAFAYYIGFFPYMTTVWLASMYIFGNFSLSHTHLPVTTGQLHWVEFAFLHTLDIDTSWYVDWWMAYLNYQVEHHLFPTMPQFRHRLIRDRVKALAARHDIPYYCTSYGDAVLKTYNNLTEVSKHLRHQ